MKKLKVDGRSAEERLMEELKLEQEERKDIILNIQADGEGGVASRPQVQLIISGKKSFAPKQNLSKPEKSI
jgi:hypothetical protein